MKDHVKEDILRSLCCNQLNKREKVCKKSLIFHSISIMRKYAKKVCNSEIGLSLLVTLGSVMTDQNTNKVSKKYIRENRLKPS